VNRNHGFFNDFSSVYPDNFPGMTLAGESGALGTVITVDTAILIDDPASSDPEDIILAAEPYKYIKFEAAGTAAE
jgi:hypothetical protein